MRRLHGWRGMLNLPGFQSTASMVAELEDTADFKVGKNDDGENWQPYNYPDYTLQIANCDRSIAFDFNWNTPPRKLSLKDAIQFREDDHANNMYKLNQMIDGLTAFRDGMQVEHERWLTRYKRHRRANPADYK